MALNQGDYEYLARMMLEQGLFTFPPRSLRDAPTYQNPPLPVNPTIEFFVTFLGGPLNGTQKIYAPQVGFQDGAIWREILEQSATIPPFGESMKASAPLETVSYKTVFIPRDETPFADYQCIIALFRN